MKGYDQRVSQSDNWLHDSADDWTRQFVKVVHLPEGQAWVECTTAEKEQWEREHPQPEQSETQN